MRVSVYSRAAAIDVDVSVVDEPVTQWQCDAAVADRMIAEFDKLVASRDVDGNGNGREWECCKPFPHISSS